MSGRAAVRIELEQAERAELAVLIHRMAGIRWRVSRKALIELRDWVSKPPLPRERAEPHPPCPLIRSSRLAFQPSIGRN
jgi:hypothetical protein